MSDYRRLAEECLRLARIATKVEDRAILVDVAARWLDLARRNEPRATPAAEVDAIRRPPA
jgi:hypothetical protein